jgi:hypothetical protein
MAERDAALGQIVRGKFQRDLIAGKNPNPITAEPASQVGKNYTFVLELNAKESAGEFFEHGSSNFDAVFFAHKPRCCEPARRERFRRASPRWY